MAHRADKGKRATTSAGFWDYPQGPQLPSVHSHPPSLTPGQNVISAPKIQPSLLAPPPQLAHTRRVGLSTDSTRLLSTQYSGSECSFVLNDISQYSTVYQATRLVNIMPTQTVEYCAFYREPSRSAHPEHPGQQGTPATVTILLSHVSLMCQGLV